MPPTHSSNNEKRCLTPFLHRWAVEKWDWLRAALRGPREKRWSRGACPNFSTPRWAKLLAWSAVIALVWLCGLPLLGSRPAIRDYIHANESLGIDPSAKFYTELPGMPDFYDRTDSARRRHAAAFGW